jgi:hypothetical protein
MSPVSLRSVELADPSGPISRFTRGLVPLDKSELFPLMATLALTQATEKAHARQIMLNKKFARNDAEKSQPQDNRRCVPKKHCARTPVIVSSGAA